MTFILVVALVLLLPASGSYVEETTNVIQVIGRCVNDRRNLSESAKLEVSQGVVHNVVSAEQTLALKQMVDCAVTFCQNEPKGPRTNDWCESFTEYRDFSTTTNSNYGGNNVTFVTGLLRHVLPDVYASVRAATKHVGDLGVRCEEMLEYTQNGHLEAHSDTGSVVTLVVMLSEPHEFRGGQLMVEDDNQVLQALPFVQKGSGYLFDSETPHKVSFIEKGTRRVLVVEFWDKPDTALFGLRPS